MAVPFRHIRHQVPVIASFARVLTSAATQQLQGRTPSGAPTVPGPEHTAIVPPRDPELVRDYVRLVGGDPSVYRGHLPAHFFPQWAFPLISKTLDGLPYPMAKVLNAGCRMELRGPLPMGVPLHVSAHLAEVDDDGRRAVLRTRMVTETPDAPEALVVDFFSIVPLGGGGKGSGGKRERPRVPEDARALRTERLPARAGLDFALATGDFNPIHWLPPYAKAFGFKSTILHGFGTMARAAEGLIRHRFGGDPRALATLQVRFVKPLVLPASIGVFQRPAPERDDADGEVFVGVAPGGPLFMTGHYALRA